MLEICPHEVALGAEKTAEAKPKIQDKSQTNLGSHYLRTSTSEDLDDPNGRDMLVHFQLREGRKIH